MLFIFYEVKMRRDSREAVYKILYAELFNPEQDAQFEQFIFDEQKLNEEDRAFANLLLAKIRENISMISLKSSLYKDRKLQPVLTLCYH